MRRFTTRQELLDDVDRERADIEGLLAETLKRFRDAPLDEPTRQFVAVHDELRRLIAGCACAARRVCGPVRIERRVIAPLISRTGR